MMSCFTSSLTSFAFLLHSFTIVIVCMMYEEKGDTPDSCIQRLISGTMFGSNESRVPDLTNIVFNFDRGYQTLALVVYILSAGGLIHYAGNRLNGYHLWSMNVWWGRMIVGKLFRRKE